MMADIRLDTEASAQNHPNPFHPTTVRFGLPDAAKGITLSVLDVLGRRVATLLELSALPAGWHSVVFDATTLPSGGYTCVL